MMEPSNEQYFEPTAPNTETPPQKQRFAFTINSNQSSGIFTIAVVIFIIWMMIVMSLRFGWFRDGGIFSTLNQDSGELPAEVAARLPEIIEQLGGGMTVENIGKPISVGEVYQFTIKYDEVDYEFISFITADGKKFFAGATDVDNILPVDTPLPVATPSPVGGASESAAMIGGGDCPPGQLCE